MFPVPRPLRGEDDDEHPETTEPRYLVGEALAKGGFLLDRVIHVADGGADGACGAMSAFGSVMASRMSALGTLPNSSLNASAP
jgi:hypothetical protein